MDGFAAVLTSDLTTLVRATYLGGNSTDEAKAIAISGANVYVAGETASTNFPGTWGGAQPFKAAYFDGFVARLDSSLSTLTQATYLGGGGQLPSFGFDRASAVAVSPLDGARLCGRDHRFAELPGCGGRSPAGLRRLLWTRMSLTATTGFRRDSPPI